MSRQRRPTADELELWQSAMGKTAPLAERPAPEAHPKGQPPAVERRPAPSVAPHRPPPELDPHRPVGVDRRTWLRLKRGQVTIEARLDLHGQTQEQAHRRLGQFLASTAQRGARCVLVVTGKGLASGGVLRHMVPRWLNEGGNRERVLAFSSAQLRDGGDGALYVLLRRHRAT